MPKIPQRELKTNAKTLLEFICWRLMGKPDSSSGNGQSWWRCPFHSPDEHPSFSTLPHRSEYKDRYRCQVCLEYGDELDVLKRFFPIDTYDARLLRLKRYRLEWEREGTTETQEHLVFNYRGRGDTNVSRKKDNPRDVESGLEDTISKIEVAGIDLDVAWQVLTLCRDACECNNSIAMESIVGYRKLMDDTYARMLKDHIATCRDPACGDECLQARGLPPLSAKQRARLDAADKKRFNANLSNRKQTA